MAVYQLMCWQEIPSVVEARDGSGVHKVALGRCFQELIDLAADKEPLLVERLAEPAKARFLLVDLGPLAEALHAEVEKSGGDAPQVNKQLVAAMLRRLSEGWTQPAKRRFSRTRLVFELRDQLGAELLLWGPVESQDDEALVTGIYSPDSCGRF